MAFKFAWLCDLLERLEHNRVKKRLPEAKCRDLDRESIVHWFNLHNASISRRGESAIAFLSCLFPERRVDRVYGLKEKKLSRFLGRILRLGIQRKARFEDEVSNGLDIAKCVEKYLREAELPPPREGDEVTLEEIDYVLDQIAASSQFSSATLKFQVSSSPADQALEPIFLRLRSHEAKWLTRMILKNFSPILIPERLCMNEFHFLLYDLLAFQDSFPAAITTLQHPSISKFPPRQRSELANVFKEELRHVFVPKINLFVRRQPYDKARSIKHCVKLSQGRQMSLERKYDGEYCQIHVKIDSRDPITIFSKSGKNSTLDRVKLHDTLKRGLRLGELGCQISSQCILEGELLVWNDTCKTIKPFRTIRKHVNRSGVFIGIEQDSPAHADDHLMIVLYDVLAWDDKICLGLPHHRRRRILKRLVRLCPGRIDITERNTIDFRSRKAAEKLRLAFAQSISQGWEGLILKGFNDAYSVLPSSSRGIKLKKDYIKGLGDTEDFVVLGGRYSEQEDQEWQRAGIQVHLDRARMKKLSWTRFHVACLENKAEVSRWSAKPSFRIVGALSNHCIGKQDLITLNQLGQFSQTSVDGHECSACFDFFHDQANLPPMATVFKKPFVVELMGAGFDRPAGVNYPMLRFPRLQKIHEDRSIGDILGLEELMDKAKLAESVAMDDDTQQDAKWIELLIRADGRNEYKIDRSQTTTPSRSPTGTSASPNSTCFSTGLIGMKSQLTPTGGRSMFVDSASPCPGTFRRKRKSCDCYTEIPIAKRSRGQGMPSNNPNNEVAPRQPLQEISNLPVKYSGKDQVPNANAVHMSAASQGPRNLELDDEGGAEADCRMVDDGSDPEVRRALSESVIPTIDTLPEQATTSNSTAENDSLISAVPALGTKVTVMPSRQSDCSAGMQVPHRLVQIIKSAFKDQSLLISFPVRDLPVASSFLDMQRQSQASFTSSKSHFVRGCLRFIKKGRSNENSEGTVVAPGALHLILVDEDSMSVDAITQATGKLVMAMIEQIRNGMTARASDAIVRKHALVTMDWHMVPVLFQVVTGHIDLAVATRAIERHFWGAFTWPLSDSGGIGSTWDLDKVMSWVAG